MLAEAAPSKEAIDLLAPEVRRKQPQIDECFYHLCIVTGHEADHLPELRTRIMVHRQKVRARMAPLFSGSHPGLSDTITLTLKCERCGDVNRYEVKSVIAGTNTTGSPYFVGNDLRCLSCDKPADFEFTPEAQMQMMACLVSLGAARKSANGESKGPVKAVDVRYRWQTRPAPEVMAGAQGGGRGAPGACCQSAAACPLSIYFRPARPGRRMLWSGFGDGTGRHGGRARNCACHG